MKIVYSDGPPQLRVPGAGIFDINVPREVPAELGRSLVGRDRPFKEVKTKVEED